MGGRSVLSGQRTLIGIGAIVSSVLYVASDVMSVQHPRGGWLSLLGALLYGFAFVGFSATVRYRW